MLGLGYWRPRTEGWTFHARTSVNLRPWVYAIPCAATLLSCVLALYLLLGIGIDYAIFFSQPEKRRDAAALAVLLSAATTSLSFGLLSLSATRLVADFGLTLLLGIGAAALIAPLLAAAPQPDTQPGAHP